MDAFLAAALQLRCTDDKAANLACALDLVARARFEGATFVATPENTDLVAPRPAKLAAAEPIDGPFVGAFRDAAAKHGLWLLLGSFAERTQDPQRIRNTSVLVAPDGAIAAIYRKIHLFDASPPDGVPYRESEVVEPGTEVVATPTPLGVVGLSVCYDLRFPELYRALARLGADVLCVPSAFTIPTGRAHWELLLRARAVENQAFVIAPAQVGRHSADRASWGHALVVDPWGEVLADAGGTDEGLALARIEPRRLTEVRTMLPALTHRRLP